MVLATTACAASDSGVEAPDPDPEGVVLTVTSEGGFVPVEFNLDRMPRYLVTGDRTVHFQGAVPAIFPGPLMPNAQTTTLSEETFDELLALVEEAGLPGIEERVDDSGAEMIADASTEFITYYDEAGAHRLGVYALGIADVNASNDRIFATEIVQLLDEATATGQTQPYVPERLQVAAGPGVAEEGISQVVAWPLDISHDEMDDWGFGWRCTEVTGDAVGELVATFETANQATLWDTGTEQLSIRARPLFPGETACAGGAPTS